MANNPYATDLLHPWAADFYINLQALSLLPGKIPANLLPAYNHLMIMGMDIAKDLQAGMNVNNDEGQEFLDAAKKFSTYLPSSMQGNIAQNSDAGMNSGGGIQDVIDSYSNTAYNAAQAINNSPLNPLGPNATNSTQIIEDILLFGGLVLGAVLILPAILNRR